MGINYAANESPITGGQDPEEDEAYRKRILDAWAHSPNGTNADYYREIALNREGITSVQVVPRSSGAGTVALYLWGRTPPLQRYNCRAEGGFRRPAGGGRDSDGAGGPGCAGERFGEYPAL